MDFSRWIEIWLLILGADFGSDGAGVLGAWVAAAYWRAAAHGGEVAGLHQNGDSGLAFERNLVRKRECGTLNRSRGLAQGHGTAEARCGGEVGRPTPVSYCARCRGKTKGNWAREGSLPRREGPGRRRGGRAAVLGQIHGSTAARRLGVDRRSWFGRCSAPPAPVLHESTRGGAVEVLQGSGRSEGRRW